MTDHDNPDSSSDFDDVSPKVPTVSVIELDGFKLDVHYFLSHDYTDVAAAAQELPVVIEWVNSKLQGILEAKIRAEDDLKESEANAWFYLFNGGWQDRNYAGKITTYGASMAVRLDPTVKGHKATLATMTAWHVRLTNVLESLRSKLELVRTSEATKRAVFQTN